MILKLEDIKSDFNGFSKLAELAQKVKGYSFGIIEVDMSSTSWFEANMSAALGVLFARWSDDLNSVRPVALSPDVEAILTKNRFLVGYGYPQQLDTHGTVIPFRRFQPEDDRYFVSYVNKHLVGKSVTVHGL